MGRPKTSWLRRWRAFVLAALVLLSACDLAPKPPTLPKPPEQPQEPQLEGRGFTLVLPVYDDAGLTHMLSTLKPYLRSEDRFMIVSGNSSGAIDIAWVQQAALELRSAYPAARLYAATSGLSNLRHAAAELGKPLEGVVYVYEPNFSNQPEFSWDFGVTLETFEEARSAFPEGLRVIGKPTGRPLLQADLQDYRWDYSVLAQTVDEMLIQTQTYCKDSVGSFAQALDKLLLQYRAQGQVRPWLPQITVDPIAPNGISVSRAQACLEEARARDITGTLLWWSPRYVGRVVSFLDGLNSAP